MDIKDIILREINQRRTNATYPPFMTLKTKTKTKHQPKGTDRDCQWRGGEEEEKWEREETFGFQFKYTE